jgi:hypothetical protein
MHQVSRGKSFRRQAFLDILTSGVVDVNKDSWAKNYNDILRNNHKFPMDSSTKPVFLFLMIFNSPFEKRRLSCPSMRNQIILFCSLEGSISRNSGSKGYTLRNACLRNDFPLETWCISGATTETLVDLINSRIRKAVTRHYKIIIYLWAGTCDLTIKEIL